MSSFPNVGGSVGPSSSAVIYPVLLAGTEVLAGDFIDLAVPPTGAVFVLQGIDISGDLAANTISPALIHTYAGTVIWQPDKASDQLYVAYRGAIPYGPGGGLRVQMPSGVSAGVWAWGYGTFDPGLGLA